MDREEHRSDNITYTQAAVSCFYDRKVVNLKFSSS